MAELINLQSINEARKRGASDDQIVSEIRKQRPQSEASFQEAANRGASSSDILNRIAQQQGTQLTQPSIQAQQPQAQEAQSPVSGRTTLPSGPDANAEQKTLNTLADVAGSRGFGETVGGLLNQKSIAKQTAEANDQINSAKENLAREIVDRRAQGRDTTNLEKALENMGADQLFDSAEINPVLQKTTKQVAGEALEFGAGTIGALTGGSRLAKGTGQLVRGAATKGVAGAAKNITRNAIAEGVVGGFGVGLQDQDAGIGKALTTAAIGGAAGGVLGSGLIGRGLKGTGRIAKSVTEGVLGTTTGTGDNAIREALAIMQEGGERSKEFVRALRGKVGERDIVNSVEKSTTELIQRRNNEFAQAIAKVDAGQPVDIKPIKDELEKVLKDFGVTRNVDGSLNFTKSLSLPIEKDRETLTNLVIGLDNFGNNAGDGTLVGINNVRMQLQETFGQPGKMPLINNRLRRAARDIIGKESKELDVALKNYADESGFIEEVQRELSVGGNPATAFKKLTGALKNNQEIRAQLVRELDSMTGGALLSNITGQQLSETMSRGLIGSLATFSVASTLSSGALSPIFLVSMLALSPRVVGETINALGLPVRSALALKKAIANVATAIGRDNISGVAQRGIQGTLREALRNRRKIRESRKAATGV